MIKLDVEECCHTCPEFMPATYIKDVTNVVDGFGNVISATVNGDIVVGCVLKKTCVNIRNHFKEMND